MLTDKKNYDIYKKRRKLKPSESEDELLFLLFFFFSFDFLSLPIFDLQLLCDLRISVWDLKTTELFRLSSTVKSLFVIFWYFFMGPQSKANIKKNPQKSWKTMVLKGRDQRNMTQEEFDCFVHQIDTAKQAWNCIYLLTHWHHTSSR